MDRIRAVALLSGGLDSTLAAKLMLEQGIEVRGVNFAGVYCPRPLSGRSNAEKAADVLGIELVTLPIDADFIAMVKNPKHGRGRNMNPCIDCHTLMIRKAWEWGQDSQFKLQIADCKSQDGEQAADRTPNARFIVTGEVLGQRPMSQNYQSLAQVARDSGTEGRLLRPLSARLLPETEPEKEGLVDRSRLLDIKGRSRKRQMELARDWGIVEYPAPAGGCLLTEKVFSARIAEAFKHGEDSLDVLSLLSLGRHFRLESGARVVIGRDQAENEELRSRAPAGAVVIDATAVPGPLGLLIPGQVPSPKYQGQSKSESLKSQAEGGQQDDIETAARMCAAYSDRRQSAAVPVKHGAQELVVAPADERDLARLTVR